MPPSCLCCYTILYTRNKASNTYTNTLRPRQTKQLPPRRTRVQSLRSTRRNNRHIRQCARPDAYRQYCTHDIPTHTSHPDTSSCLPPTSIHTTPWDRLSQPTDNVLVRVLLQFQHNTKRQRNTPGPHGVARKQSGDIETSRDDSGYGVGFVLDMAFVLLNNHYRR
jgi:hypothetical protein